MRIDVNFPLEQSAQNVVQHFSARRSVNDLRVLGVFYGVSSLGATHCPYGWMDALLCEQSLLYSDLGAQNMCCLIRAHQCIAL